MWKKIILVMAISTVIFTGAAGAIFADSDSWGKSSNLIAEGGKVRGDIAEGPANQLGECPFTG